MESHHGLAIRFPITHLCPTEYVCTYQCFVCAMCLSLHPPLPTGTLQKVNPSLPACFATDRHLFITTSWLARELCPTVSNCYTGKPKYSLLTPTHRHTCTTQYIWADEGTVEEERRRKNIFFFVPLLGMCCSSSGSPSVTGRWEADKVLSDSRSPLWTLPTLRADWTCVSPPLSTLSPPSEQVKIGIMFSILLCRTTALFMPHHYVLMELCGEKINSRKAARLQAEHTHAHKKTHWAYKQGLARWALPVEPVVCVARKWEWVIAAEVVAGIGILKGPNGCIYKNNNTEAEKQKQGRQRGAFQSEVLTFTTVCSVIWMHKLGVILSFSQTWLASMPYLQFIRCI